MNYPKLPAGNQLLSAQTFAMMKQGIIELIPIAINFETNSGRYLQVTGEIGEVLISANQGLVLAGKNNKSGYDAFDPTTQELVQIKTTRMKNYPIYKKGAKISKIKTPPAGTSSFHYALLGIVDQDYTLKEIWKVDVSLLLVSMAARILKSPTSPNLTLDEFFNIGHRIF